MIALTTDPAWADYLAAFHASRPGITEAILTESSGSGESFHGPAGTDRVDPYDWLLEDLPAKGLVLDVAAGSAPLWPRLLGRTYVGIDLSASELGAARARGATGLVRAAATKVPLRDASVDIVACSMGLHLIEPLPDALTEIARVLKPGGRLVAIVPADAPIKAVDWPLVIGLLATLGRRLRYPNDAYLAELSQSLADAGLRAVTDQNRRFGYRITSSAAADRFLTSLYLPNLHPRRHRAAELWLRFLARLHADLPVPVRRIVAVRSGMG